MLGRIERFTTLNKNKLFSGLPEKTKFYVMKIQSRPGMYASVLFYLFVNEEIKPRFILKVNRTPSYTAAIENEYKNLKLIHEKFDLKDFAIPKPNFCEKLEYGSIIMCESAEDGESQRFKLMKLSREGRQYWGYISYYLKTSLNWLIEFQKRTKTENVTINDKWLKEEVFDAIEEFMSGAGAKIDTELKNKIIGVSKFIPEYKGTVLPVAVSHGDFNQWNILINGGKVAVVDWEDVSMDCVYKDFCALIFHLVFLFDCNNSEEKNYKEFFKPSSPGVNIFHEAVKLFSDNYELPYELFFALSPIYVLKAIQKKYPPHRNPESIVFNSLSVLKMVTDLSWKEINNDN